MPVLREYGEHDQFPPAERHHVSFRGAQPEAYEGFPAMIGYPVKPGPFDPHIPVSADCQILRFEGLLYGRTVTESGMRLARTGTSSTLQVMMPLAGHLELQFDEGQLHCEPHGVVVVSRDLVREAVFHPGLEMLYFAIPFELLLRQVAARFGGAPLAVATLRRNMAKDDRRAITLSQFAVVLSRLLGSRDVSDMTPFKLRRCRDAILDLVLLSLGLEHVPNSGAGRPASLLQVERAESFMRQNCQDGISIADVARHVGISTRALQMNFQTHRMRSPLQVLQDMRLHGVREDIIRSPSLSVHEVAKRWGFPHAGRLSAQYRKRFGETPGKTVRAVRAQRPLRES